VLLPSISSSSSLSYQLTGMCAELILRAETRYTAPRRHKCGNKSGSKAGMTISTSPSPSNPMHATAPDAPHALSLDQYDYTLPDTLIARYPAVERAGSRLLCLDEGGEGLSHRIFNELPSLLKPEDLLVINDTRVIPARLLGRKLTGGAVELLVERQAGAHQFLAMARSSKPLRVGARIEILSTDQDRVVATVEIEARDGPMAYCRLAGGVDCKALLEQCGHVPLPPYLGRSDEALDVTRYQTVYARAEGSVAAPTAGLHFDTELLERIRQAGTGIAEVTLHVGAGTFAPVRVDDIRQHTMHREWYEVGAPICDAVRAARERGGRVVAVGTTAVRALESAASPDGSLAPGSGETDIFIYPGYPFRVVDALITNFHLPRSTLLMLVSAFAGRERVLAAYAAAVRERYRFFSYGDAMWLSRQPTGETVR